MSLGDQSDLNCARTKSLWEKKGQQFNCSDGRSYHCLRDENQNVIQLCLKRSLIQPAYCPVYDSRIGKLDVRNCDDTLGLCSNVAFPSDETYKYPACWKDMSEDVSGEPSTVTVADTTYTSTDQLGSGEGGVSQTILIVSIIVPIVVVIAAVVISLILYKICGGKCKRSPENRTKTSNEEPWEAETPFLGHSKKDGGVQVLSVTEATDFFLEIRSRDEQIKALIENNLQKEGGRLLFIGDDVEAKVEKILKEHFDRDSIMVKSIGDWSITQNEKEHYVLMTCLKVEGKMERFLRNPDVCNQWMKDIKDLGLRVLILIEEKPFRQHKKELERSILFKDMKPFHIR